MISGDWYPYGVNNSPGEEVVHSIEKTIYKLSMPLYYKETQFYRLAFDKLLVFAFMWRPHQIGLIYEDTSTALHFYIDRYKKLDYYYQRIL